MLAPINTSGQASSIQIDEIAAMIPPAAMARSSASAILTNTSVTATRMKIAITATTAAMINPNTAATCVPPHQSICISNVSLALRQKWS